MTTTASMAPASERRLRAVLGVVGAALIVIGVPALIVNAVRPPDLFRPGLHGVGTSADSMPVGETLVALMAISDTSVRLDRAELVVAPGSAVAAVELVACQRRAGAPVAASLYGAETLSRLCEAVHEATAVEVGGPIDGQETYLVAVVQPLQPGRVLIEGIEVTHSRGPFHRTERTGEGIEIVAR